VNKLFRIIPALLVMAAGLAAQNVTYHTVPNMAQRSLAISQAERDSETQQVKAMMGAKLIVSSPFELVVLANESHAAQDYGFSPVSKPGAVKTWWGDSAFEGVFVARNADGSWATEPINDSLEGFQWLTRELSDFYKAYRSHFPKVPKFVTRGIPTDEVQRAQFGPGPAADFPLAKILRDDPTVNFKSTFPQNVGLVVKDGELKWFKLSDYRAAFPINTTLNVPPPVAQPPLMVMGMVSMIFTNPELSAAQKVEAVKAAVGCPAPSQRVLAPAI
jgi:hypothetical protein